MPLLVTAVALLVLPPSTALAADTTQYAIDRNRGNGVAIPFEGYTDQHGNPVPISGAVGPRRERAYRRDGVQPEFRRLGSLDDQYQLRRPGTAQRQ